MTTYILKVVSLLGGLVLFLFGMDVMGKSLERSAGGKLQTILAKMSSSVPKGFLLGLAVTAVIQSSSATVGILQSLCSTGVVTFGSAIPVILGQNIGTCVTAMMGSIGANKNARRTAMVHLYFNLVGTLIFVVLFYGIGLFFPWDFLESIVDAKSIAVIHTCFNIGATAVLLPLSGLLVKLAELSVPDNKSEDKIALLDERLLATPAVAVQRAHEIAGEMSRVSAEAMQLAIGLTRKFDDKIMEQVVALEDKTDHYTVS